MLALITNNNSNELYGLGDFTFEDCITLAGNYKQPTF